LSAENDKLSSSTDDKVVMTSFSKKLSKTVILGFVHGPSGLKTNYLGIGLDKIQVSDKICLFQEARVPYVVRADSPTADSKTFTLICEYYIYGFMDG